MPAIRTEAQRQTARINGAKSLGPTSEAGKSHSRRNALKHGLSASTGQALPDDLQQAVDAELAAFRAHYRPKSHHENNLVRAAALSTARLMRLMSAEVLHTQTRVRRAVDDWDAQRAEQVAALALLLETDPATAMRGLARTAEGCDFLADAWDALAVALEESDSWTEEEERRAANLLGQDSLTSGSRDPRLVRLVELLDAVDQQEKNATAKLRAFVREQEHVYISRSDDLWQRLDAPERAEAPRRAMFDPSPEYARLARYMAAAERTQRRALAELAKTPREHTASRLERWMAERPKAVPVEPPHVEPAPAPAPRPNEPDPVQPKSKKHDAPSVRAAVCPQSPPEWSRDPFADLTSKSSFVPMAIGRPT